MCWKVLKKDGSLNSRLFSIIDKLLAYARHEKPTLKNAAELWGELRAHWHGSRPPCASPAQPWADALSKAFTRLEGLVETIGMSYVSQVCSEKSKHEALEVINGFPSLPGLLKDCQAVLTGFDSLVKIKDSVMETDTLDISALSKIVGNVVTVGSYDKSMLKSLLPDGVPEALEQYVENAVSSLQGFIETMNVEIADMREVIATYRPDSPLQFFDVCCVGP